MIDEAMRDKLKENWTDAEALNCFAYIKFVGVEEHSKWAAFLYAMNPQDEDEVLVIFRSNDESKIEKVSLQELLSLFNTQGEYIYIDKKYIPRHVSKITKDIWKY